MPKLPAVMGREAIRALERAGFEVVRTKGSHHMLRRTGNLSSKVTVPAHGGRDLAPGTPRSILQQAGLSVEDFIALL